MFVNIWDELIKDKKNFAYDYCNDFSNEKCIKGLHPIFSKSCKIKKEVGDKSNEILRSSIIIFSVVVFIVIVLINKTKKEKINKKYKNIMSYLHDKSKYGSIDILPSDVIKQNPQINAKEWKIIQRKVESNPNVGVYKKRKGKVWNVSCIE